MPEYFNVNMTSTEARSVLFSAVDGKSKEEIEEIKKQYFSISGIILKRELDLVDKGWIIN